MRCSVVFGVTLRFLVINISSSSAINTAAYYQQSVTTCATMTVVHRRPCWQHLAVAALTAGSEKARYRLRIAISTYPPCIRRPRWGGGVPSEYCYAVWHGKLEWCGYATVKKFRRYLYSFLQNARTWQTHRQTDTARRHRPRLCIASRGKNEAQLSQRGRTMHRVIE